jgi:hypothetical protein
MYVDCSANLSTALLVGATSLLLMFIGRVVKHLLLVIGIAMIRFSIDNVFQHTDDAPEQKQNQVAFFRVTTWVNRVENFMYGGSIKEATDDEDNYQVNQATAIVILKAVCSAWVQAIVKPGIFFRILIQILFMPSSLKSMD